LPKHLQTLPEGNNPSGWGVAMHQAGMRRVFFNRKTGNIVVASKSPGAGYEEVGKYSSTIRPVSVYCPEHEMHEFYSVCLWAHSTYSKISDSKRIEWTRMYGCSTASTMAALLEKLGGSFDICIVIERFKDRYGEQFLEVAEMAVKAIDRARDSDRRRRIKANMYRLLILGDFENFAKYAYESMLRVLAGE